jgi:hypothetical protein
VPAAAGGFGFRAAEARTFRASDGQTLHSGDGSPRIVGGGARALPTDLLTVGAVSSVPLLRLVTRGSAAETRASGARAGRGTAVELLLPEEPTVSGYSQVRLPRRSVAGYRAGPERADGERDAGAERAGGPRRRLDQLGKSAGGHGVASPDRPRIERGASMPAIPLWAGPPATGPAGRAGPLSAVGGLARRGHRRDHTGGGAARFR